MEDNRFKVERIEYNRKRKFDHRSQMTDKAREYPRAKAEMSMDDPRTPALMQFSDEKCEFIKQELNELSDAPAD